MHGACALSPVATVRTATVFLTRFLCNREVDLETHDLGVAHQHHVVVDVDNQYIARVLLVWLSILATSAPVMCKVHCVSVPVLLPVTLPPSTRSQMPHHAQAGHFGCALGVYSGVELCCEGWLS